MIHNINFNYFKYGNIRQNEFYFQLSQALLIKYETNIRHGRHFYEVQYSSQNNFTV